MDLTADDYLQQLQALLPPGHAWPREPDSPLTRLLQAFADEFGRVQSRAGDLLDELFPLTAVELLPEWERIAGVAGAAAVAAQLAARGGASKAYFIGLASRLGLTVTIDDRLIGNPPDFTCVSPCNAPLVGSLPNFSCTSPCDAPLQGYDKRYWWRVHVAAAGPRPELEALFIKFKPAHTRVDFAYQ